MLQLFYIFNNNEKFIYLIYIDGIYINIIIIITISSSIWDSIQKIIIMILTTSNIFLLLFFQTSNLSIFLLFPYKYICFFRLLLLELHSLLCIVVYYDYDIYIFAIVARARASCKQASTLFYLTIILIINVDAIRVGFHLFSLSLFQICFLLFFHYFHHHHHRLDASLFLVIVVVIVQWACTK